MYIFKKKILSFLFLENVQWGQTGLEPILSLNIVNLCVPDRQAFGLFIGPAI